MVADDGSTAVAAPTPPTPRERGTLRDTLPGRPFAIFLVLTACTVCSALAASLVVYSFPAKYEFANDAVVYLFLMACLGSVSTAVGVVFGDSLTHLLAFGVAVRASDAQAMPIKPDNLRCTPCRLCSWTIQIRLRRWWRPRLH